MGGARDVEAAERALKESDWSALDAVGAFYTALERAYPEDFDECLERLREGDGWGLETIIQFLEADPGSSVQAT